ncbi:hypothetical protein SKAU_G00282910 [Synaphobranchus kaupii]|uniref:Uncharacterized protein n=1 Tax=Synaphobranchus kaupii TaxID=118154 RepID=A0A9Q1EXI4_SYNKA|nr:hypothetical protein SKAU_G00282910 [Synaphobranchus kaupii]
MVETSSLLVVTRGFTLRAVTNHIQPITSLKASAPSPTCRSHSASRKSARPRRHHPRQACRRMPNSAPAQINPVTGYDSSFPAWTIAGMPTNGGVEGCVDAGPESAVQMIITEPCASEDFGKLGNRQ